MEFAAALGKSTDAGRRYLSHAVEGRYRLKLLLGPAGGGQLPAWQLAFIADRTLCSHPRRRRSSTPTSRTWRTRSAPRSWTG